VNAHLLSAVKSLLDAEGPGVLQDARRVDAALPVFANKSAMEERRAFILCVSSGAFAKLKKQTDLQARLECKKRLASELVNSQHLPVAVVKESFDLIETALYGSATSSKNKAKPGPLRIPIRLQKYLKPLLVAASCAALAAAPVGIALYSQHTQKEASASVEEILKRITRAKQSIKEDDENDKDKNENDKNDNDGGETVVFLKNFPGYGYQTADGVWHFVEGARRADGTVYRNGRWITETPPPATVPPVSVSKPWSRVPDKDRRTLIEITREVAKHYDYHGDGVVFTEDGDVDCEDYAIAFYLLAKERGYNVKIVVSNTIRHAFNTVTINGATYIVEPQAGEWKDGDLFEVDDIRYGGTWGNPHWRGSLYDLRDIEDNTRFYIEKYVL
jgi:hypothetical protein